MEQAEVTGLNRCVHRDDSLYPFGSVLLLCLHVKSPTNKIDNNGPGLPAIKDFSHGLER